MLLSRTRSELTRLDPDGYYQRLGLEPTATAAQIVAAFRGRARVLHPDVPNTGNAGDFVAMKQAYDVLSDAERRAAYDRKAREALHAATGPRTVLVREAVSPADGIPNHQLRLFDPRMVLWIGLGAFLMLCVYQAATHLLARPRLVRDEILPNAPTVKPLSPGAHEAMIHGVTPVRLAGTPNFYVVPAASPAVLWRLDTERNVLAPLGLLPPFSSVQAVRAFRQNGLLEVLVDDRGNGFVGADHLVPGNASAARQAYCSYNAGPTPSNGDSLERHGSGNATLAMENRAVQPAVVKLRDDSGSVVLSVFLGPGGHVALGGLPPGSYHAEFAIGELWSRACNAFAAGMRARRIDATLSLPGTLQSVVVPDAEGQAAVDIPDEAFARK